MARILYFGRLSDITGDLGEDLHLPDEISDSETLRTWLDKQRGFSGALLHKSVRIAINGEIATGPMPVCDKDEIAFLPPVGGG